MNIKDLNRLITKVMLPLLITCACQRDLDHDLTLPEDSTSLSLQFSLTEPVVTKGNVEESLILNYIFQDGELKFLDSVPDTKAGDGNTADGGGMADLSVFLVDNNDNIVARKSFSNLTDATAHHINFLNLEPGEYTAYAYANTVGNDWFSIPSENETSFARYKEALLKTLSNGVPIVQNNRMPLTAKQEITVLNGNNSRKISMTRPVSKFSITVINERTDALTINSPLLGNFLPATGYVFKHDGILPQSASNPYYAINFTHDSHSLVPGGQHVICNTLLYETVVTGGVKISMHYQGAEYEFQKNLSGNLQHIKQESLLIKLYNPTNHSSNDQFLRLDQTNNGTYQLELVSVFELDDKCFWKLSSNGKQQRGITNVHYNISLNMKNGLSFSSDIEEFKFGGSDDYAIIGGYDKQLTYNPETGQFSVSSNGTAFQFYTYVENNNSGVINSYPIKVHDIENYTPIDLITINRNQDIRVNIIFR